MKKLLSIAMLMIITLSIILSSCTEEESVTPVKDGSGTGERSDF